MPNPSSADPSKAHDYSMFTARVRIHELMKERGIKSLAALSPLTGLSYSTLIRLSTGKAVAVELDSIARLCIGLRCTPNELFEIDTKDDIYDENASNDAQK